MFIDKLERAIKGPSDAAVLEKALVALSIEDARFDERDSLLKLNSLLRTSRNVGIDARGILLRVGEVSSAAIRNAFVRTLGK